MSTKVAKRLARVRKASLIILVLLFVALCYYMFTDRVMVSVIIRDKVETASSTPNTQKSKAGGKKAEVPAESTIANGAVYKNQRYGIEVTFPNNWSDSGDSSSFTNPDLLEFRQFVPSGTAQDFIENPQMMTLSVFNKNPNSSYQNPKAFMERQYYDEWDRIRISGNVGTKITHTVGGGGVEYVFDRNNLLYVFYATDPALLETALLGIRFF